LAGVHETPAVHALHEPLSHTMFVPHVVPFDTLVPVSLHTGAPLVHTVVPVWHGLAGVQTAPEVHALQVPLSQTSLVPHEVPLLRLPPVSTHVDTPVEHDVVPVWHALAGVHDRPAVHAVHVPLSQTSLVPHEVPLGALVPWSAHVMLGEQLIVPLWHTFVGVQEVPAVHDVHEPLSQTWLVPHDVPLGTLPVELQTDTPVEQEVTPV
jgi:hypothetical protein